MSTNIALDLAGGGLMSTVMNLYTDNLIRPDVPFLQGLARVTDNDDLAQRFVRNLHRALTGVDIRTLPAGNPVVCHVCDTTYTHPAAWLIHVLDTKHYLPLPDTTQKHLKEFAIMAAITQDLAVPTHPSNRKVIERAEAWGAKVTKSKGHHVELRLPNGEKIEACGPRYHDGNPSSVLQAIAKGCAGSVETFWTAEAKPPRVIETKAVPTPSAVWTVDEVAGWLHGRLEGTKVTAKLIEDEAAAKGIHTSLLAAARSKVGVRVESIGGTPIWMLASTALTPVTTPLPAPKTPPKSTPPQPDLQARKDTMPHAERVPPADGSRKLVSDEYTGRGRTLNPNLTERVIAFLYSHSPKAFSGKELDVALNLVPVTSQGKPVSAAGVTIAGITNRKLPLSRDAQRQGYARVAAKDREAARAWLEARGYEFDDDGKLVELADLRRTQARLKSQPTGPADVTAEAPPEPPPAPPAPKTPTRPPVPAVRSERPEANPTEIADALLELATPDGRIPASMFAAVARWREVTIELVTALQEADR